ncbi:uncharacterized protein LOC115222343 [Octopus sinensis]|uniref:Uncharacterized protein LOC115222343 n=1 Tax=Octopus sinensis TaxID=2607531 RepID=A0A6P7TG94_9MOLL|nr:uncharacterized protein LOC115222343 [Octopus sinensis]
MCRRYENKEEELGFKLHRQRSRWHQAVTVTDLNYADDLALLTERTDQAQEVLSRLEQESGKVGLYCNANKTELQVFSHEMAVSVKVRDGKSLKVVENFKYLGVWTQNTEKDIVARKALAWRACHKLRKVWSSKLARKLKVRLFLATVESVLHRAETGTLTKALKKQLDGCYARVLRMALNVSWKSHTTNADLYQGLPKVALKIQHRRMRLDGHCIRHTDEIANKLVIWQPTEGRTKKGKRKMTYINNLRKDTGMEGVQELRTITED